MSFEDFEKYFAHLDLFMSFFITGYFGLYVFYGNVFLNYDILTRIILSISASFILLLTFERFREGERFEYMIAQSINIILIFATIKLFKFNGMFKENSLWYIPLFCIIYIANRAGIYYGQRQEVKEKKEPGA